MKRYLVIALLALTIPMAASSQITPARVDVYALPSHPTLNESTVRYVAVATQTEKTHGATTLLLTITARLSDVTLDSIPDSDCVLHDDTFPLRVVCKVVSSPTAVTVRGILRAGTPHTVVFTAELDGAIDSDVQWVRGAYSLYIPFVVTSQ